MIFSKYLTFEVSHTMAILSTSAYLFVVYFSCFERIFHNLRFDYL